MFGRSAPVTTQPTATATPSLEMASAQQQAASVVDRQPTRTDAMTAQTMSLRGGGRDGDICCGM